MNSSDMSISAAAALSVSEVRFSLITCSDSGGRSRIKRYRFNTSFRLIISSHCLHVTVPLPTSLDSFEFPRSDRGPRLNLPAMTPALLLPRLEPGIAQAIPHSLRAFCALAQPAFGRDFQAYAIKYSR